MRLPALISAMLLTFTLLAHSGVPKYAYTVDLENIVGDRIYVELLTPEINKRTVRFYLPKVVPGTYSIYDFGRFISGFRAEDSNGNLLHAERDDINTFVITDARKLHRISYWVDDTFDDQSGVKVAGMSGTNIEDGRGVVLNGHGFFGYFEGMKNVPFEVTLKKAAGYHGATAMQGEYPDDHTEIYRTDSYNYLVDMPILYAKPDTTSVRVGNTAVTIAVTSPGGNVTSAYIAEHFAGMLEATRAYMGGSLPVDKYAFLMHFLSPGTEQMGVGALEHNYSSLYVLPDVPQEQFIQPITDIAAHEFFHIVTPLNVHSEEIRYFDFNDPKMSRHLWMYEGVTEYFAHHAQLVHGSTGFDYFLKQMQDKVTLALQEYDDALPFTELSRHCLDAKRNQYGNVYQKGALIGLCLDVILRQQSNGEMGLMDLMLALMDRFGKDQPFKDRKLFREIGALSYPEVTQFLKRYVDGRSPLPLKEVFAAIGVEYHAPGTVKQYTYGNIALAYNADANRVIITSVADVNRFGVRMGYRAGDEIVSINGKTFDPEHPMALFHSEKEYFKTGELLKVEVVRKEASGAEKRVVLSAPLEQIDVPGAASLKPMRSLSPEQEILRSTWERGVMEQKGRS